MISVIVCSYNREKYIADAIISLMNQTLSPELYEVLIIDNNSKDRTAEISKNLVERYSTTHSVKYCLEVKQGLSYARNRGILEANGDWLCYIDDDAIAESSFLENIHDFILKHPEVGGLGGKILPRYVHGKPAWMNRFMEGLVSKVDYGDKLFEFKGRRFPVGCNMTYSKMILEKIGCFDVELGRKGDTGLASEEKDVYIKVTGLGASVYYLPTVIVEHVIERGRLQYEYIKKISEGIGTGERIRVMKMGSLSILLKNIELAFKFFAGCLIAFAYITMFQFSKAKAIFLFRVNVMHGWFRRIN